MIQDVYKISVAAPGGVDGVLDVHEALGIAMDFFSILKVDADDISLNIKSIVRENPLIVECLPYNSRTHVLDYESVEENARSFVRLCDDVLSGRRCSVGVSESLQKKTIRMLKRTSRGVSEAICVLGPIRRSITFVPESAGNAAKILEFPSSDIYPHLYKGKAAKGCELGEIDGEIIGIIRRNGKPVLKIEEPSWDKKIWCSLADSEINKWKAILTAEDAWRGKRVRVRGELVFDRLGRYLDGVKDGYLREVEIPPDRSVGELFDPDFTGGMSVKEYLRKRWDGGNS